MECFIEEQVNFSMWILIIFDVLPLSNFARKVVLMQDEIILGKQTTTQKTPNDNNNKNNS